MKRRIKLVLLVPVVLFLIVTTFFYFPMDHEATFDRNEKITLLIYDKGFIKREVVFSPNSKEHDILNQWLESNNEGWNHSITS